MGEEESVQLFEGKTKTRRDAPLNSDLGSGSDSSGEDSSESVESSLVGGGHHLRDVEHEGSLGVTVPDTDSGLVVHGSLVKGLHSVPLGSEGGGEVDDNHLEEGVSGGEEPKRQKRRSERSASET